MARFTALCAALLLAGGVALARSPTLKLVPAGAKADEKGAVVVQGYPNGHFLSCAIVYLKFDPEKVTLPTSEADFLPGPGWSVTDFNPDAGPGTVAVILLNFTDGPLDPVSGQAHFGQFQDGPVVTIRATPRLHGFTASTVTMTMESQVADETFEQYFIAAPQSAPFVNGPVRFLDDVSLTAMSAGALGNTRVVAVAAGRKLYVMRADDLTDMPGWEGGKDTGLPLVGRPTFGMIDGNPVLMSGSFGGIVFVFSLTSGEMLASTRSFGGTPPYSSMDTSAAIAGDGSCVYWAGNWVNGPFMNLLRLHGTCDYLALGSAGVSVTSPLVYGSSLLVGTSEGVKTFRVEPNTGSLTPQTTAVGTECFTTAPVLDGTGNALLATATGRVYSINTLTGEANGQPVQLPAKAAPLSDPFFNASTGMAVFGGHDGRLYYVRTGPEGALTAGPVVEFSDAPLTSPVSIGGSTYVADTAGTFGRVGAGTERVHLGTSVARAVVATGVTPGVDKVFINTTDGSIIGLPLQ